MKRLLMVLLLIGVAPVAAHPTYTPRQLNRMINSGHYPAQGKEKSQSEQASFVACKRVTNHAMTAIRGSIR